MLWTAAITTLSVFGPYISGSLRLEQFVLAPVFVIIVILGWPTLVSRPFSPLPVLLTWLALLGVIAIGTLWRPTDLGAYGQQAASHGLGAMITPVMLIIITWFWAQQASPLALIRVVARTICAAMTVNALISLVQFASNDPQVIPLLPRFWSGSAASASVAAYSAGNGRYTGIFDQPAVSGIAYGLGLLCLIYLVHTAAKRRWSLVWLAAILMTAGGLLAVSKTFVFGALPILVLVVARTPQVRLRMAAGAAFAGAVLWSLAAAHVLPSWPSGVAAAKGLVSASSLTSQATGGRYGSGGTLGPVISDVLHSSPVIGFGAGGLNVAYDSLWVEVMAMSGLVGLILMAGVFIALGIRLSALRLKLGPAERSLAWAALVLAAAVSLGIPSLTTDPAASLLWLILGLLITGQARRPAQAEVRPDLWAARPTASVSVSVSG
jgi:hypothetical protein